MSPFIPAAASLVLAATSAGCVHAPAVARLTYPPWPADGAPQAEAEVRPVVALRPLADERPKPGTIAVVVPYGRRHFVIETRDDVPAWATRAVRIELERSGLRVTDRAEGDTPVIGGAITGAFFVASASVSGRVTLRVRMEKGGERPIDRTYSGAGRPGERGKFTAEIYEQSLADALRDAAARLAADASTVARGEAPSPVPPPPGPRASGQPTAVASAAPRGGEAPSPDPPPPGPPASGEAAALGFLFAEATLAGLSGLAARWPEETGWTLVAGWPLGFINAEASTEAFIALGSSAVAIGLYNALELRSDRYSRTERFWLNMGGWHAVVAIGILVDRLRSPERPEPPTGVGVGVGVAGGAPAMLVGGRF